MNACMKMFVCVPVWMTQSLLAWGLHPCICAKLHLVYRRNKILLTDVLQVERFYSTLRQIIVCEKHGRTRECIVSARTTCATFRLDKRGKTGRKRQFLPTNILENL